MKTERSAVDEGVHVIGLSILSGSHRELIPDVMDALREAGVAAVYTPKDFDLGRIMRDIVALVAEHHGVSATA